MRLFYLIGFIWENARQWMAKQLRTMDLTFPQHGVLIALSQGDGITQRELSEKVGYDTTTTMVVIDSLEKKGLVRRLHDPSDRRVNRVTLTEAGKEISAVVYPAIRDGCKEMLVGVPVAQLGTAIGVLDVLYKKIGELPDVFSSENAK